jgi:nicotinamide mononucleotide transporter
MVASVFSLAGVALAMYKNYLTFAISILGTILYTYIFFDYQLYADAGLQIIFIVQSVWGILYWKKDIDAGKKEMIYSFGWLNSVWLFIATLGFAFILAYFLENFTNASLPRLDAFLTSLSISATWLLTKKYRENWLYWILADTLYIGLFYYKALYITALLYLIFLGMAINGWNKWKIQPVQ